MKAHGYAGGNICSISQSLSHKPISNFFSKRNHFSITCSHPLSLASQLSPKLPVTAQAWPAKGWGLGQ